MFELHKDYEYINIDGKAAMILEAIKNNDGHCPCQIPQTDSTICLCKDFRDKLSDINIPSGTPCICRLYKKK